MNTFLYIAALLMGIPPWGLILLKLKGKKACSFGILIQIIGSVILIKIVFFTNT